MGVHCKGASSSGFRLWLGLFAGLVHGSWLVSCSGFLAARWDPSSWDAGQRRGFLSVLTCLTTQARLVVLVLDGLLYSSLVTCSRGWETTDNDSCAVALRNVWRAPPQVWFPIATFTCLSSSNMSALAVLAVPIFRRCKSFSARVSAC